MRRSTQWTYNMVCFSIFFCCSFKSMFFFIAVKNVLKHTILYVHSLESKTIEFFILWFFCNLLWFFETALGGNLTSFEKFRRWYRLFHRLGGYVFHPHRLGWCRLFPNKNIKRLLVSTRQVMSCNIPWTLSSLILLIFLVETSLMHWIWYALSAIYAKCLLNLFNLWGLQQILTDK